MVTSLDISNLNLLESYRLLNTSSFLCFVGRVFQVATRFNGLFYQRSFLPSFFSGPVRQPSGAELLLERRGADADVGGRGPGGQSVQQLP